MVISTLMIVVVSMSKQRFFPTLIQFAFSTLIRRQIDVEVRRNFARWENCVMLNLFEQNYTFRKVTLEFV